MYVPILREELYSFVRLWNSHSIRKQKNRPNAVVGKPFMLYHHPGSHVQNWGVAFDTEQLREMKTNIGEWDIDAFLPLETLNWCNGVFESLGFSTTAAARSLPTDRTAPYIEIYLLLREKMEFHIQNQFEPALSLLATPVGAQHWRVSAWFQCHTEDANCLYSQTMKQLLKLTLKQILKG